MTGLAGAKASTVCLTIDRGRQPLAAWKQNKELGNDVTIFSMVDISFVPRQSSFYFQGLLSFPRRCLRTYLPTRNEERDTHLIDTTWTHFRMFANDLLSITTRSWPRSFSVSSKQGSTDPSDPLILVLSHVWNFGSVKSENVNLPYFRPHSTSPWHGHVKGRNLLCPYLRTFCT